MIVSASRRTDIPALYPQWFVNRLLAEEVLVPNPYNKKKVTRVPLTPDVVDCFVFWTKNPEPMLPYLKMIDLLGYQYYFQMTITDYGKEMQPNLPAMEESIASFILLSERLGKEKVDFRFDPIILNETYPLSYHLEQFEMLCSWLHKHTTRCMISFVDPCKGCPFPIAEEEEMEQAAEALAKIGKKYGLPIYTCGEKINLEKYGIYKGACIDPQKIQQLVGYKLDVKKDNGQRKTCGCCESIDIGMYDTCVHGCQYCYATANYESARKKHDLHNPESPILIGSLRGDEIITEKRMVSVRDNQLSLFDFMY